MSEILSFFAEASLTAPDMALAAAAVFFSGLLRAFVGFGFAMALVPLLALIVGPAAAVPMALLLEMLSGLQMLPKVRKKADWHSIRLILPMAMLTAPFGVYLLDILDADSLRILISVALLGAVALMASGFVLPSKLPLPVTLGIGSTSGLLAGSTAMAGPPVLVYFLGRADTPEAARASMFMYFSLTSLTTLTIGLLSGVVPYETLVVAFLLSPALFLSNILGTWAFHAMGDHHYKPIALSLLTLIALVMLVQAAI